MFDKEIIHLIINVFPFKSGLSGQYIGVGWLMEDINRHTFAYLLHKYCEY